MIAQGNENHDKDLHSATFYSDSDNKDENITNVTPNHQKLKEMERGITMQNKDAALMR